MNFFNMRTIILLLVCLMSLSAFSTAQNQTLTPELLWKIGRVGLEDISPDGRYALYGVQRFNVADNKSNRVLYQLDLQTGASVPLTPADASCSGALFHPDGERIGFLRDGKLCETPLGGGAINQVAETAMNGFRYAPNGKAILFAADVKLDKSAAELYSDLPKTNARIIDGLFYRHWKSWHDYQYSNVFYAPYEAGKLTGEPVNIMNERFDSPLRPMGGMEQITWSPDSRHIVYTCRKLPPTEEAQSTNADLFLFDTGTGKTRNLTEGMPGYDMDPVYAPDGRYLAWTSMERAGFEADRTRIMLLDMKTGDMRELTRNWSYEAIRPQWAADGKSLFFSSSTDFTYHLFEWRLAETKPRQITRGQYDYKDFKCAGNALVAMRTAMDAPAELYRVDPRTGEATKLTSATDDPWATIEKCRVERRTVRTTDGKDLNVWVILPPGFDPSRKYPAILYCQGGPQSALSQGFSYRWNFQLMASNGYVVVAPCRRGMPGSGQGWCDAITGDWSGKPIQDLLDAIDDVAREPWVDKNRLGAVGASYGGYAVYWLAGHHNKRFKAFISHCGLFNLESWYGTTEELWFANHDIKGPYWDPRFKADYDRNSPHRYVDRWDTPILVIHNELDFRVPLSEGMQAFQAAQIRGIPSKFLYFPDEGHWVSKAQNSILWQREFAAWLGQHL